MRSFFFLRDIYGVFLVGALYLIIVVSQIPFTWVSKLSLLSILPCKKKFIGTSFYWWLVYSNFCTFIGSNNQTVFICISYHLKYQPFICISLSAVSWYRTEQTRIISWRLSATVLYILKICNPTLTTKVSVYLCFQWNYCWWCITMRVSINSQWT